ncbi:MAG: hypothetical protein QM802_11760 [Agriterribacter sp.]
MKEEKQDLRLTLEDTEANGHFKNLSPEQKEEVITLVFERSNALYHLYTKENENEENSNIEELK